MMSEEMVRVLRAHVLARRASPAPAVRQLADCISHCLAAHDDRLMPPPEVSSALSKMLDDLAQPSAPLVCAARALLAELAGVSVSPEELSLLVSCCASFRFAGLADLGSAIDAGLRFITEGAALDPGLRGRLDDFVASECDSVALAVASLLRAVDARAAVREVVRG